MTNYENGKIYKLICSQTGSIYIGSTNLDLKERLKCHKKLGNACSSKELINPIIELVEKYPCKTKEELLWRERMWFDKIDCVNKRRPIATKKENNQKGYETHKKNDKWVKYRFETLTCECGGKFSRHNKARHLKSARHLLYCKSDSD